MKREHKYGEKIIYFFQECGRSCRCRTTMKSAMRWDRKFIRSYAQAATKPQFNAQSTESVSLWGSLSPLSPRTPQRGNLFDSHGGSVIDQSRCRRFRGDTNHDFSFRWYRRVGRYVVYVPTMEKIPGSGAKIASRSEQEKRFRSSPLLSPPSHPNVD